MPEDPPPILDYRTPKLRSFLPGWSISCLLAGVLCWLPTSLTTAVIYNRWKHPRADEAGYSVAVLLCFLAAPSFGFAVAVLSQQKRQDRQRGALFLKLSLLALTISLALCVLMIART
ncbi:MAG: hypothetical protein JWN40_4704 [Phycisphaerales bacterium]|nr:hypothetical protein [Phycisphaerales bacterium]